MFGKGVFVMSFVVGQVSATVSANTKAFDASMNKVKAKGSATMSAVEKSNATAMKNVASAGQKASQSLVTSFQLAGKKMQVVGKSMLKYISVPLLAIGVGAFKLGKDFEIELQKVVGLVGIAQEQVDAWGEDILEMGPKLGVAPKELAEGLFFVTSAGIRGAEAMDVLKTSGRAAMVGLGETKIIADTLTSAINAYGTANLSATQAADILTAAVREGKLEASALAPVMGNLLPMASAMDIGFAQVAGSLAVMSRVGADAATSATSLNAIMMFLQKPTKEAVDVLDTMNLSMQDLRDMARQEPDGLLQVMRMLDDTFGNNEEAMAQIIPNIRALRGVMSMLSQDGDTVDSMMQSVANSTGMLDEAVQAVEETMEVKWKKALAEIQVTFMNLFDLIKDSVMPVIEGLGDKFKAASIWIKGLDEGQKKLVLGLGAFLLAAGPVILILGKLTIAITALIPLMSALFANPVGLVIGLVAAIGLSATAIIKLGDNMDFATDRVEIGLEKQVGMFGLSAGEIYEVQKESLNQKIGLIDAEIAAEEHKYTVFEELAKNQMKLDMDLAKEELKGLKVTAADEMKILTDNHTTSIKNINEEYGVATGLSKSKLDIIKEDYKDQADEAKKTYDIILKASEETYQGVVDAANIAYEEQTKDIKDTYKVMIDEATKAHDIVIGLLDKQLEREKGAISRELDLTVGGFEDKISILEGASADEIAARKKTRETTRAIALEDLIVAETDSVEKQKLIAERETLIQGIIARSSDTQLETSKWLIRQEILGAKEKAAEEGRTAQGATEKLKEEAETRLTDSITNIEKLRDGELKIVTNLYKDEIKLLEQNKIEEFGILERAQTSKLGFIEENKIAAMTANEAIRKDLEEKSNAEFVLKKADQQKYIDYLNDTWLSDKEDIMQTDLDLHLSFEARKTAGTIKEIAARKVALAHELTDVEETKEEVIAGIYKDIGEMDFADVVSKNLEDYINQEINKVPDVEGYGIPIGKPIDINKEISDLNENEWGIDKDKWKNLDPEDLVGNYAVGTPYVPKTGLAVVHQGEQIIPAGGDTNYGAITMHITQHIDSKETAEYTVDYLVSKLQRRAVGGAFV